MPLPSDIPLKTIDGKGETLGEFDGKALLIVNVASKCGFTPQYAGLEELHRRFRDREFAVLGPCDQFGHQEPGDEAEILQFCSLTYDVSFPMFSKIEVNGPNAHPLYKALKRKRPGLFGTEAIKWNFTKFLVDKEHQRGAPLRADRQAGIARPRHRGGALAERAAAASRACRRIDGARVDNWALMTLSVDKAPSRWRRGSSFAEWPGLPMPRALVSIRDSWAGSWWRRRGSGASIP